MEVISYSLTRFHNLISPCIEVLIYTNVVYDCVVKHGDVSVVYRKESFTFTISMMDAALVVTSTTQGPIIHYTTTSATRSYLLFNEGESRYSRG